MSLDITLGQILAAFMPVVILGLVAWGFRSWASRMESDNQVAIDGVTKLHDKMDTVKRKLEENRVETIKLINKETQVLHKRVSDVDTKVEKVQDRVDFHHPRRGGS